jgi:hypothetical protein
MPAEVIDHVLLRGPFSAGARQCPASRVASLEVTFFAAQLVRDWKISLKEPGVRGLADIDYVNKLTHQPIIPELVFEPRGV